VAQHPAPFSVFIVRAFFQGTPPCWFDLVVSCSHRPESGFNHCVGPSCLPRSLRSVYWCAWIFSFWFLLAKATVVLLCTSLQLCYLVSAQVLVLFCKVLVCESLQVESRVCYSATGSKVSRIRGPNCSPAVVSQTRPPAVR
jgi:hypothetical protein